MTKTHHSSHTNKVSKGSPRKETQGFDTAQIFRFLLGAGGIYFIYIMYGLIQERIFKTNYSRNPEKPSPKFQGGVSLVFFQSFLSYVLATIVNNHSGTHVITSTEEKKLSLYNFLSMITSNTALGFVSYPVQALMKSAKVLSILLVGLVFGHKHHTWLQYLCAILITIGIFVFQILEDQGKKGDKATSYVGIALLIISLFSDGMLADVQKDVTNKNQEKLNSFEIMATTNKYCFVLCLVYAVGSLQIISIYEYILEYPAIIPDLAMISILGVVGQVCIFFIIRHFGPVILGIVTTTRKFFTVIASILIFNHSLNPVQWLCVFLVFAGVSAELYDGLRKKKVHNVEKPDLGYTEVDDDDDNKSSAKPKGK